MAKRITVILFSLALIFSVVSLSSGFDNNKENFDMGRIKTSLIKSVTLKLFKNNKGLFKDKFEDNKLILNDLIKTESKKLRNIIAGYITRLVKQEKSEQ